MSRRRFLAASLAVFLPAVAQATPTAVIQEIQWTPSSARYTGTLDDALARFSTVFTPAEMEALRGAVLANQWAARVTITRDQIATEEGGLKVLPRIAMMHFGVKSLALRVHRDQWPASHSEGALVYAAVGSRYALIRPAVCGNWAVVELAEPITEQPCQQRTLLQAITQGRTPESMRRPCKPAAPRPAEPEPIYGPGLRMALQPSGPIAPWAGNGLTAPPGFSLSTADVRPVGPAGFNPVPEPGALALVALAAVAAFTRKGP